ncbi:hypothetical protein MATR_26770 [Marivirga tractuosa]|uniref:Uncharacterized protein n=1 Tax=Marivirga tractuosa (strain ATCC 23168 / DSM 4126 / NBRC 15989 / NCIMB 1408 / VKM B-1430 / H-43) TaxID=643867 RepID=E4TN83_MARTH|nr:MULTISPECIES: hypothetical protein [Marivirga]ADR23471.1 hypothetical protein Ftrac_3499 [Marivirga tractuosa DSM 4126]BDD15852.1 hypothetical protein MATR_26770 [Marivirga tractuosa]HET8861049.1 hypothetical protein [Marivirga sp.]
MEKALKLTVNDYTDEEVKEFDGLRKYCSMESMDIELLKASKQPEEKIEKYKEYKEICLSNYRAANLREPSLLRQRDFHEFSKEELEKFTDLFKIKILDPSYVFENIQEKRLFKEVMIAFHLAGPGVLLR